MFLLDYLLTIHDDDDNTIDIPFQAPNDLQAEQAAHDHYAFAVKHEASIARYTLKTLHLGRYNPKSHTFETSTPETLFDSRVEDNHDEPRPSCPCGDCARVEEWMRAVPSRIPTRITPPGENDHVELAAQYLMF